LIRGSGPTILIRTGIMKKAGGHSDKYRKCRPVMATDVQDRDGGVLLVDIVKRSDRAKGFVVEPKCWIVERSSAWVTRSRGLADCNPL
jgi:hypothetical protein